MECLDFEGFSEVAREHAMHPRNYGPMKACDGHARITGPCGDTMEFWLTTQDGKVIEVMFTTDGCGSSRACGSMTTCLAEGRDIAEVLDLQPKEVLAALGACPPECEHCARLAVTVLRAACDDYFRHLPKDGTCMPDGQHRQDGRLKDNPETDKY